MSPLATKYNRKLCKYQVEPLQRFSWAETRQSWMSHTAQRSTLFILASWHHCMVITFYLICFWTLKSDFFLESSSDPTVYVSWHTKSVQPAEAWKDEPLWSRLYLLRSSSLIFTLKTVRESRSNCAMLSGAIFCLHDPNRGILSTAWHDHWAKALAGIMNRPPRWQKLPYKGYLIPQQQHSARIHALDAPIPPRINTLISLISLTSIFFCIKTKWFHILYSRTSHLGFRDQFMY